MFEGSFDLPSTRFMEKVKAAVSEEDFQRIKKEILTLSKERKIIFAVAITPHSQKPTRKYIPC